MPKFPPELARAFARMAKSYSVSGESRPEDYQAVAYASRVSIEQSLKSALEKAGYTEKELRTLGHNLGDLLGELSKCTVAVEITPGGPQKVSASRVRSRTIHWHGARVTIGDVITSKETSKFPGEYRYGNPPTDYPAEVLAEVAHAVADWVAEHWDSLSRHS